MTTPTDPPVEQPPAAPPEPGHGIGITPAPPASKAPYVPTKRDTWIGGGIAGALILACTGWAVWMGQRDNGNDAGHARLACEEGVKGKLISPASADFSNIAVTTSGDTYTVTGNVDSDNALGVSIRNTFICKATLDGDTWEMTITGLTR